VRRGRTGRSGRLRGGSITAVVAKPGCQDDEPPDGLGDGLGLLEGGGLEGGGLEGGGLDGGDVECDGFGEDDVGAENFEVGAGEPECFRPAGPDVPGCGVWPPGAALPGAFEPGRFGPAFFE
jgi:hypothetical protein